MTPHPHPLPTISHKMIKLGCLKIKISHKALRRNYTSLGVCKFDPNNIFYLIVLAKIIFLLGSSLYFLKLLVFIKPPSLLMIFRATEVQEILILTFFKKYYQVSKALFMKKILPFFLKPRPIFEFSCILKDIGSSG